MSSKSKLYRSLIKNFRFRSVFFRFFSFFAVLSVIILVFYGLIAYRVYSISLGVSLSQYSEKNLAKTTGIFDIIVENIEKNYYLISNDESIKALLVMDESDIKKLTYRYKFDMISGIFLKIVDSPAVESIYVYGYGNGYILSGSELIPSALFYDKGWQNPGGGFMPFARVKYSVNRAPDTITFTKEINSDKGVLGLVIFNVKYDVFGNMVDQYFEQMPDNVYIISGDGNIFYATEPTLLNAGVFGSAIESIYDSALGIDGRSVSYVKGSILSAIMSADKQFVIVSSSSNTEIYTFNKRITTLTVFGGVIGLLLSFLLAFFLSAFQYRYIIQIISLVGLPLDAEKGSAAGGELSYITQRIIGIIDRDKRIEEELPLKFAEIKKAQSIALQNQINPHFILNALNAVNLSILAETHSDCVATKIVSLLSELLYDNLKTKRYLVPLSHEIQQAKKYVEIENIRSMGQFTVEWNIDETMYGCQTIKFILQPILENSIFHGLINSPVKEKKIVVSSRKSSEKLLLVIWDNGLGISAADLEGIRERLADSQIQEDDSIGLCNVDKRIKLLSGNGYGVSIDSIEGESTTVTVTQPLINGNGR